MVSVPFSRFLKASLVRSSAFRRPFAAFPAKAGTTNTLSWCHSDQGVGCVKRTSSSPLPLCGRGAGGEGGPGRHYVARARTVRESHQQLPSPAVRERGPGVRAARAGTTSAEPVECVKRTTRCRKWPLRRPRPSAWRGVRREKVFRGSFIRPLCLREPRAGNRPGAAQSGTRPAHGAIARCPPAWEARQPFRVAQIIPGDGLLDHAGGRPIARLSDSLSTLRRADYSVPRKTRFRLLVRLHRMGFSPTRLR